MTDPLRIGTRAFVECTEVEFAELSEGEIAAYIATGEPFDKAVRTFQHLIVQFPIDFLDL